MPLRSSSSATRKRMSLAAARTQQQSSKIRVDAAAACEIADGVLHSVFSYAGKGQWLFIALVCQKWQAAYKAMLRELQLSSPDGPPAAATAVEGAERVERVTLFSAALESVSCLQYAVANGLQVDGLNGKGVYAFARSCGRHGHREVILWARQAGMPWNA
jgi:hypothetical protein